MIGAKAEIALREFLHAARGQSSADQHHARDSHLADDRQAAQPMTASGHGGRVLQQRQNLQPRRLPCGKQTGKNAGGQRCNKGENIQAPVGAGVGSGRHVAWNDYLAEQWSHGDCGYCADGSGGEGEQRALGEQLAQQPPTRRSQSAANRQFMLAIGGARIE